MLQNVLHHHLWKTQTHMVGAIVFRTMVSQLLRYERIETTVAKAKELKRLADKVVTIAKEVLVSSLDSHVHCHQYAQC